MSEIDEGLDEIRDKYTHRVFLRTYNKERWFIDEEAGWSEFKQAILDLMCKLRGCNMEIDDEHRPHVDLHTLLKMRRQGEVREKCKWCGKEAG